MSIKTAILTLAAFPATASAADFPREKVDYVCDTAPYYYTESHDECMLEQYGWYQDVMSMGLPDHHYKNALWYGQKYGYMGDVVGVDFKYVIDRAKYLEKQI